MQNTIHTLRSWTDIYVVLADLSPYEFLSGSPPALNVGWLDASHAYTKGKVSTSIIDKLRCLAVRGLVNKTRGFHQCPFCPSSIAIGANVIIQVGGQSRSLGSAEIWVPSQSAISYAAPDLIIHYIEAHEYRPPDVFLDALSILKVNWVQPTGRILLAIMRPPPNFEVPPTAV